MQNFLLFSFAILLGFMCRRLALQQGKNPTVWFLLGVFCGVVPLAILIFFPPKPKVTPPLPKEPTLRTLSEAHVDKLWYYLDADKTTLGPMSLKNLTQEWKEGKVGEASFVWNEDLDEWKRFADVLKLDL